MIRLFDFGVFFSIPTKNCLNFPKDLFFFCLLSYFHFSSDKNIIILMNYERKTTRFTQIVLYNVIINGIGFVINTFNVYICDGYINVSRLLLLPFPSSSSSSTTSSFFFVVFRIYVSLENLKPNQPKTKKKPLTK